MGKTVDVDKLTLASALGGDIEEQFQACIAEAMRAHDNRDDYQTKGEDQSLIVKITPEILLEIDQNGAATIYGSCNVALPKRRLRKQMGNIMNGKFMVHHKPMAEQMPLTSGKVVGEIGG